MKPGEMIGIVGASGTGKSTLINLIMRLYEVDDGAILVDGTDIKKVRSEKYHAQLGVVLQETFLFSGTILENIRFARPDASYEEVIRAAKLANAHDFISKTPDGYNTYVGERGHSLSGGERQRIAIARAVINEPKVLLLDEPLGALDLKLRRQMQLELKRLQKQLGITFIYITHDQEEAINMSDRIGVMHEGVLEQLGTPNEVYYQPRTSYVADFVGNANILHLGSETLAIRTENILMNGEEGCVHEASVVEKSFAGGQLRILFRLPDGQLLTASRYGIDHDLQPGQTVKIGWDAKNAVKVIDNDEDEKK